MTKLAPDDYPRSTWLPPDGPPLALHRGVHRGACRFHRHDFHELVVVERGTGWHRTSRDAWRVVRGDVFLIDTREAHGYESAEDLRIVNLLLDPDRMILPEQELRRLPGFLALFSLEPARRRQQDFAARLRLADGDLVRTLDLLAAIEAELRDGRPGSEIAARALFVQLAVQLARTYEGPSCAAADEVLRLAEAVSFIERRCTEPVCIAGLAIRAGLSERHFHRLFRQVMGRSPVDHLIGCRIRLAQERLRGGRDSITAVALACGFSDPNYFTRQFRQRVGVSPRAWRAGRAPTRDGG